MTRRFVERSIHARSFVRSGRSPVRCRSAFTVRRRSASFRPRRSTRTKNAARSTGTTDIPSGIGARGARKRRRVSSLRARSRRNMEGGGGSEFGGFLVMNDGLVEILLAKVVAAEIEMRALVVRICSHQLLENLLLFRWIRIRAGLCRLNQHALTVRGFV